MRYFISIFLLFIITCKSKTDESDTKQAFDTLIRKTNFDLTDTNCIVGIQKARVDIKNRLYKKISYGIAGLGQEYIEVLKQDYNIEVECKGCEADGSEECYNSIMDSAIIAKFGKDIFLLAERKADSLTIKHSKVPSLQYPQKVNEIPQFKGGQQEFMRFLKQNIRYPSSAIQNNIQGRVFAQFTVDNLGNITDILILKGISSDIDKESIRVLKSMPKWEPAKLKGKNVSYIYRIPILFTLGNK